MEKSPEAFRTISEVADFLETPAHVLRFWESRFPQIRPVKRAGGRRYYRPSDVALLAGIKRLLHDDGMTIRGVQKILREHGIRYVAALGDGADPALLPEVAPDAPVPPDFAVQTRFDIPAPPATAHTAQIIPLDSALGRGEASRPVETAQLWPMAEEDDTGATEAGATWPSDPNDPVSTETEEIAEPDLFLMQSQPEEIATAETPLATAAPMADAGTAEGAEIPDAGEEPPPAMEVAQTEPATDDAAEQLAAAKDMPPESDQPEAAPAALGTASEAEDENLAEATVAALLRRAQRAKSVTAQAELRDIRDRLILLRGRVADAARRRVK
ncbi:MerR family transcriptional regulator [Tabrizicola sp. M-4]|uniref:MerR family transcriptional regulator n=1 Tax=Tabrizicola sp. M-4 TaxID=3055847 RepID=UPI003DA91D0C